MLTRPHLQNTLLMKKRCRNWVQYNSFNVNTVSAASQISRSGPHVLIISSSQGEASPATFVGLIRLENTTIVESDRMCLWAWERKDWVHPFPTLGYLTLGKSSSLFLRQPHGEAQRAKGMKLTNSNDMWSLPAGVHNGTEMVGQSTKCFIGSCKPEFNPPECTLKKKKKTRPGGIHL